MSRPPTVSAMTDAKTMGEETNQSGPKVVAVTLHPQVLWATLRSLELSSAVMQT